MRIPKLRGFKNRFRIEYEVVNVGSIAAARRARRVRDRGPGQGRQGQGRDGADHDQPGHPARRRSRADAQQAAQDPGRRRADGHRCSSSPTRSPRRPGPRSRRPAAASTCSRSRPPQAARSRASPGRVAATGGRGARGGRRGGAGSPGRPKAAKAPKAPKAAKAAVATRPRRRRNRPRPRTTPRTGRADVEATAEAPDAPRPRGRDAAPSDAIRRRPRRRPATTPSPCSNPC